jgi:CheY-like chemotaxis protein
VEKTLRRDDRIILKADNGEKAVEIATTEKPDLIMMDVIMPGKINGLEATKILKNDERTRDCTILILTARGRPADKEEGLKSGADDYFTKPFSPLELMRKVDEYFG